MYFRRFRTATLRSSLTSGTTTSNCTMLVHRPTGVANSKGKRVLMEQLESDPESTWLGTWGPLQPTEVERRFDP